MQNFKFWGFNEWEISVFFGPLFLLVKALLDALTNSAVVLRNAIASTEIYLLLNPQRKIISWIPKRKRNFVLEFQKKGTFCWLPKEKGWISIYTAGQMLAPGESRPTEQPQKRPFFHFDPSPKAFLLRFWLFKWFWHIGSKMHQGGPHLVNVARKGHSLVIFFLLQYPLGMSHNTKLSVFFFNIV